MAATNVIPIYSREDIGDVQSYLADTVHPHHRTHTLIGPVLAPGDSASDFAERVERSILLLNREHCRQHQIEIRAQWAIWRFEDRSTFSALERWSFEQAAQARFSRGGPLWGFWHCNWLLECDDFNLLVPAFYGSGLPVFRSQRSQSFYSECREFVDEQILILNEARRSAGKNLMQTSTDTYIEATLCRRWETIERKLAAIAAKQNLTVSADKLPQLFGLAGLMENEDWLNEGNISIRFCCKKRKKSKWFRARIADLLTVINREIGILHTRRARAKIAPHTADKNIDNQPECDLPHYTVNKLSGRNTSTRKSYEK